MSDNAETAILADGSGRRRSSCTIFSSVRT